MAEAAAAISRHMQSTSLTAARFGCEGFSFMKPLSFYCSIPLLLALGFFLPVCADTDSFSSPATQLLNSTEPPFPLFAAPRWWDETVAWIRSIGWDRGRLVQLWLFFMLVGLYIIVRIKPRG